MNVRRELSGFTLIEVVAAGAVLALAALGLAASLVLSLRAGGEARERTIALAAAERQMERLIALAASDDSESMLAENGRTFAVDELLPQDEVSPVGEIEVTPLTVPLVQATVRVRWLGTLGAGETSLVTTLLIEED